MAESISTKTGVDFKALDHDARAAALVGTCLKHFALMEFQIDDTIAKILKLTGAQQFLLSPNITFHSKINVLGCLLHLSDLAKEDKDKYAKVMGQMRGYSGNRNVIAHSVFFKSDTSNGVEFLTADARGKLKFPEYDWSIAKFEERYKTLTEAAITWSNWRKQLRHSTHRHPRLVVFGQHLLPTWGLGAHYLPSFEMIMESETPI